VTDSRRRDGDPGIAVRVEEVAPRHEDEFIAAARRSVSLHDPWVSAPTDPDAFRAYVGRLDAKSNAGFLLRSTREELVGVVNVNEIVRGRFQSAYLGYYAFVPHHGRGYMTSGLAAVVSLCFGAHGLHRLEANIQPGNDRSIALVKRLGFRREGYSERYLSLGGAWRDHERWAITREEWPQRPQGVWQSMGRRSTPPSREVS
jgi:ribosomal-protein-alanine N-acetyltransferase